MSKPNVSTPTAQWQFEAIGTQWWIGIYQPVSDDQLRVVEAAIAQRIEDFDKTYSRFRIDSLITRISEKAGTYQFPPDAVQLFDFYRRLYDATDGLVTPLIGQVLSDAGYDAAYTMRSQAITTPPSWDDVLTVESATLTTTRPVLLDFGAAGKGYLADIVSEVLKQHAITYFCVDASGDMVCQGLQERPLRIGMEHPDDAGQVIGVITIGDGALCASAGNRRRWGKYHHIIDPKKHTSPSDIKAVWVTASTVMEADGLTTALYFATPQKLRSLFTFEYAMMYTDDELQRSSAFSAEIFTR